MERAKGAIQQIESGGAELVESGAVAVTDTTGKTRGKTPSC